MRLHYFSSGPRHRVLQALLDAGHTVETVIITSPERWPRVQPTLALAQQCGIPVRVVNKAELSTLGKELSPLCCLSAGFGFIFPQAFIEAMPLVLNCHGTLLPHYAGNNTLYWILANNEPESGVTVHRIDAGVDTGPILLQERFALSPFETGRSLYRKTLAFEPTVVLKALQKLEAACPDSSDGLNLHLAPELQSALFTPQDLSVLSDKTQVPDWTPERSQLDASQSLEQLYHTIRTLDPERYPAYFRVNGEKVYVKLWREDKPAGEEDLI